MTLRARLTLSIAAAVLGTSLLYGALITGVLVGNEWRERQAHQGMPRQGPEESLFGEAAQALAAMALATPVAVLGAVALGRALARQALTPLREASTRARAARASALDLRLPVRDTGDEWDELATTLNDLLEDTRGAFTRMRSFTSDAAHELRTPLTVIMGESEVSLRRERTPEEYRRSLEIVHDESRRLSRLVDELLQLARADTGALAVGGEPVDLYLLAQMALRRMEQPLAKQSRSLSVELSGGSTLVRGNPVLLGDVLDNLLSNARRHARHHLRVDVQATASEARVTVRDDGAGVDPALLPRLFQRFARADPSRQGEGTGLGLALSRALIEAHGGTLDYARGDDESCFTFRLPTLPAAAG